MKRKSQASGRSVLRKRILYTALFLLIAIVTVVGATMVATHPAGRDVVVDRPLVKAERIGLDRDDRTDLYSGEVRGRHESQLAFQVGGKIVRRFVEIGSEVRAGDVLLRIDPRDIGQAVAGGEANHAAALSQYNLAATNHARYRRLFAENVISRAEFERVEAAYLGAQAQLRAARAQYDQLANQLAYCSLRADRGGVVTAIHAEEGQVVGAGQCVATLVGSGEREVEIQVPENRIAGVKAWSRIEVRFWALPEVKTSGRVREISPVADRVTRTFRVRVALDNPPRAVAPGMTASIRAGAASRGKAIHVPLAAVFQTGTEPCVWLVRDGTVVMRPIKVGEFREEFVRVLDGLADGDMIVTAGVHKLRLGQQVRVAGAVDEKL